MKLAYITAHTPWKRGEVFILNQAIEIKRLIENLLIIPRNPNKEIFHEVPPEILENSIWLPLVNYKMMIIFLKTLFTNFLILKTVWRLLRYSRNPYIFIKNLTVLPKSIFISLILKEKNIDWIHAHWGGTTSTMAYIISQMTHIPWSLTLHRWDIKENNLLEEKVRSANFVISISYSNKDWILKIIGEKYKEKIKVIYLGVKIPENILIGHNNKNFFRIGVVANLIEVKGHKYLVEACSTLIKNGIKNFECIFWGDGHLRNKLEHLIKKKKLTNYIKIPGTIPNLKLLEMYKNKEIDMVILPSINTAKGEHEGIPVCLMEAMAYSVPVISTHTGSIAELLFNTNNAGLMVLEKNSEELANAIKKLMEDKKLYTELQHKGYKKVQADFNIEKNSQMLLEEIKQSLKNK